MPKYVIERELPGAGKLSADELHDISAQSNKVIAELGPEIKWLHSYVTDDKIYCIYLAHSEDEIRRHAKAAGLPATLISPVKTILDPINGN